MSLSSKKTAAAKKISLAFRKKMRNDKIKHRVLLTIRDHTYSSRKFKQQNLDHENLNTRNLWSPKLNITSSDVLRILASLKKSKYIKTTDGYVKLTKLGKEYLIKLNAKYNSSSSRTSSSCSF